MGNDREGMVRKGKGVEIGDRTYAKIPRLMSEVLFSPP